VQVATRVDYATVPVWSKNRKLLWSHHFRVGKHGSNKLTARACGRRGKIALHF
jgi:hypothetical protein